MGFFSSRKTDDDLFFESHGRDGGGEKPKVVQVIRSRFYGKHKGKAPEHHTQNTFVSQDATPAQTLSIPPAITNNNRPHVRKTRSTTNFEGAPPSSFSAAGMSIAASPTPPSRTPSLSERIKSTRAKLSSSYAHSSSSSSAAADATVNTKTSRTVSSGTLGSTNYILNDPSSSTLSPSKTPADKDPTNAGSPTPRKTTDTATMSLAQRLNELAVANSEGLLNDDEYRILRQNIFERFASNAAVPTENPIVPATPSRSHLRGGSTTSEGRSSISRPPSNFIVEIPRSPSIRSRTSVRSGVAGLFQRATSHHKQSASNDFSDSSSVFSFRSPLQKKSSSASVRSAGSQQTDAISISSKKTGIGSERDFSSLPPQTPRSTAGSIRHMATPPSSFHHARSFTNENKLQNTFDDENLKTSQDIKKEIAAVEAEGRRLMDAFNGLEVTILSKRQRNPNARAVRVVELEAGGDADFVSVSGRQGSTSTWTLTPDNKLALKVAVDNDGSSIRSGTSVGTSPSISRSLYLKTLPSKTSSSMMSSASHSRPGSLHRKNSSSSMGSARAASKTPSSLSSSRIPPVPALPSNMGQYYGHASNSSLNLTRSTGHLPMRSVPEDEVRASSVDGEQDVDAEMEEIRQRREDVAKRYAARVEYLRAKLKGAQLHEKLMRK
ncbi:hypothetical protein VKT23_005929 [Stygiomarasmius scandens]|uniref:Uncharacterized protein n=1 Tax=Marasmiellus scandens TaxID=2682957 RepID=A0ABR1JRM6_9AGAR